MITTVTVVGWLPFVYAFVCGWLTLLRLRLRLRLGYVTRLLRSVVVPFVTHGYVVRTVGYVWFAYVCYVCTFAARLVAVHAALRTARYVTRSAHLRTPRLFCVVSFLCRFVALRFTHVTRFPFCWLVTTHALRLDVTARCVYARFWITFAGWIRIAILLYVVPVRCVYRTFAQLPVTTRTVGSHGCGYTRSQLICLVAFTRAHVCLRWVTVAPVYRVCARLRWRLFDSRSRLRG